MSPPASDPVLSFNEWDTLEEVIVGSAFGSAIPAYEPAFDAYHPLDSPKRQDPGRLFDSHDIDAAERQLDGLATLLEGLGIVVRRPDPVSQRRPFSSPDWSVPVGHAIACPRDTLLVVGDEIIEAPSPRRARFFETNAYRSVLKDYCFRGARWSAAPKPILGDELFVPDYDPLAVGGYDSVNHPNLTEHEPVFEAASFARLGRDLFWQPDIVSNEFGALWLARHLGETFRVHRARFLEPCPEHIDTTLVPLRPGLALTNPTRPAIEMEMVSLFETNGWRLIPAPPSVRGEEQYAEGVSSWISMNVLSLDPSTVIVEEAEWPLAEVLRDLGFETIPCSFDAVFQFGGSFHCCTLDVRRQGKLESYFGSLD